MLILGIDPGIRGAFALLQNGKMISYGKLPILGKGKEKKILDLTLIRQIIEKADHVFIEKAQSFPKQGISSTGRYLEAFGMLQGLCAGLKIPYTLVHPSVWKRALLKGMAKGKASSLRRAKQLFPNAQVIDEHEAEAMLIAYYGWLELQGVREVG